MQAKPVLAALRKHRVATAIIALEIAFAFAVLCNACFLIARRIEAMHVDSGVAEHALGTIKLEGFEPQQANDLNARVVGGLRGIAGVQSISVVNAVPFGEPAVIAGVYLDQANTQFGGVVDFYVAGPGTAEVMGIHLLLGRMPTQDEYMEIAQLVPKEAPVLLTRVLAEHFWPGQNPIGKMIWGIGSRFRVIGIVDHLTIPQPGAGEEKDPDWSIFIPGLPGPQLAGKYLLRADPRELPRVMRDVKIALRKIAPDSVIHQEQSQTLSDLRRSFFLKDRAMAELLACVILAMLGTTALGIIGLTSFWVMQRRKQIGIRRALGAARGDILRYFQVENFLIVTLGVAFGMTLAFAINMALMQFYELPQLPIRYLPFGAVVLWVLGQLSVLGPALRAAAIPPMAAMR